jgi:hypothetical protein
MKKNSDVLRDAERVVRSVASHFNQKMSEAKIRALAKKLLATIPGHDGGKSPA